VAAATEHAASRRGISSCRLLAAGRAARRAAAACENAPTSATFCPGRIVRLRFWMAGVSGRVGYAKVTFLSSTSPATRWPAGRATPSLVMGSTALLRSSSANTERVARSALSMEGPQLMAATTVRDARRGRTAVEVRDERFFRNESGHTKPNCRRLHICSLTKPKPAATRVRVCSHRCRPLVLTS